MKKYILPTVLGLVGFIVPLAIYWLSGNDFHRSPDLGIAFFLSFWIGGLGAIMGLFAP